MNAQLTHFIQNISGSKNIHFFFSFGYNENHPNLARFYPEAIYFVSCRKL